YARIEVKILGDEVTAYRKFVKIPDDWSRQQDEKGLSRLLYNIAGALVFVALGAAMLTVLIRNYRTDDAKTIPWKRISSWSIWFAAVFVLVVVFGDRLAFFLQQYSTAVTFKTWSLGIAVSQVLGGVFSVAALIFVFGLAWFFCRRAFGEERLPNWWSMPRSYYRDALVIGICGVVGLGGLENVVGWISAHYPTAHRGVAAAFGSNLASKLPAVASIGGAISHALMFSALVAAIGGFIAVYVKPWALRVPLFLVGAATQVGDWGNPADFAKQYVLNCVLLAAIILGIRWLAGLNLFGIFLVLVGSSLLTSAMTFLGQANGFYRGNGYAILGALAALFAWPLVKWLASPSQSSA